MPERTGTGRGPVLIALALVVCCAGHALLVAFGAAAAVAAFGPLTGKRPVVAAGVVGVALAGTAVLIRVQRHLARASQNRTDREGCRS